MSTKQTSLHPTKFVSSSFLFIVKDNAARDLIFSDPYITKHSKVHCICKYLSLSLQQWSLINNRYNLYEYYIFVSVCVSRAGSPLLISLSSLPFFLSQLFLLSQSLSLFVPSVLLFHCYCYSVCLCLIGGSNAKDYWFTRSLYRLHVQLLPRELRCRIGCDPWQNAT